MSEKLTPKRREMLKTLANADGPYGAAAWYPPLKWLLEKGYAETVSGKYSDYFKITPLGRTLLKDTHP